MGGKNSESSLKARRNNKSAWCYVRYALYSLVGLLVIAGGTLAIFLYRLRPQHHFAQASLPVAARPSSTSTQTAPGASQEDASNTTTAQLPVLGHDGVFNLLLLGTDAHEKDTAARTDSIILIHVNLVDHTYNMLSIPRDTRVLLPGYGYTKITHANYLGDLRGGTTKGIHDIVQAVSNLTGVPVNYYAETNYWGLQDLVDAIGGINMYVPYDMKLGDSWYGDTYNKVISKGMHFFNGEFVTEVVHERNTLPNGDFGRQELQKEALVGIAKRLATPDEILHIQSFVQAIPKYLVATNMTTDDMLSLAMSARGFQSQDIHYFQVPGTSGYAMDPVVQAKLYYWMADENGLKKIIAANFS